MAAYLDYFELYLTRMLLIDFFSESRLNQIVFNHLVNMFFQHVYLLFGIDDVVILIKRFGD